jgi:hypothetical protein
MNFRIRIVELKPNVFSYAHQFVHSSIWQCGGVCAVTARQAATAAVREKLVPTYYKVDEVIRALLGAYPDMIKNPIEISFDLAFRSPPGDGLSAGANADLSDPLQISPTPSPRGGSREAPPFAEEII